VARRGNYARNSGAIGAQIMKSRGKLFSLLRKLNLTLPHEKFNRCAVINFVWHDFAQHVRFAKGVILHGS
jgi:hypothetical protein